MKESESRSLTYAHLLAKMIRYNTNSFDSKTNVETFYGFQALLRSLFPCLFEVCEFEDFDGSFLLKWKGKGSGNPVLFMNHQDVVPPQDGWSVDAFGGVIKDGKLWGRGTLDTKGGLFCMLQAAEELVKEGFVPPRDVFFESSCCEEITSSEGGCAAIVEALKARGIRFDFVLDEGGMALENPIGGVNGLFAMVGVSEKGVADLRFTAKSTGGHASTPVSDSPLVRLGKFMAEADKNRIFPVCINEVTCEMLKRFSKKMKGFTAFIMRFPHLNYFLLKFVMPRLSASSNAMVRTTLAFTMASGSDAINVMPASASVYANMRYSHHQCARNSFECVKKLAAKYGVEMEVLDPGKASLVSSFKNFWFKLIEDAVSECIPNCSTAPYIQVSASDSRFLCEISDNVYRFVPFVINSQQMASIHGTDENVDIVCLPMAVDFYKFVMQNLK